MASEEEETVRFLTQEAKRAVAIAQSKLMEQGIGYVTGDEFSVQKHLPLVKKKGKEASRKAQTRLGKLEMHPQNERIWQ